MGVHSAPGPMGLLLRLVLAGQLPWLCPHASAVEELNSTLLTQGHAPHESILVQQKMIPSSPLRLQPSSLRVPASVLFSADVGVGGRALLLKVLYPGRTVFCSLFYSLFASPGTTTLMLRDLMMVENP